MFADYIRVPNQHKASDKKKWLSVSWGLWFSAIMGGALLLSLILIWLGPNPAWMGWILYGSGAALIFYRPRWGLYLTLFLTLVGDPLLLPWYPFPKNFSSLESLLFVDNSLIVSPLETYLFLLFVSWLGRGAMQRKITFFASPLFWPAVVFMLFIFFGLVYGISTGGNINIALWEARPIFYLFAMLILASNLLEKPAHVNHLMWSAVIALFIEGLVGCYYYFVILNRNLADVEAITEHSAAIHMNTVFVFMLAVWVFKASAIKKFALPFMAAFIAIAYLVTQRRAAFVALVIALIILAFILLKEKPFLFWATMPFMAIAGLAYLGIFWNAGGALGLPAQAIKSVIAPEQASEADQSSNIYRAIENVNTGFTIHQKPLTGVGFGQKFYIIVPLPDISFFAWWEYFPHNSIIWIWIKTGIGGFIAMLFLVGYSILLGARMVDRVLDPDLRAIAITATIYIVMHFTYAYVDISWDTQSMLYVGAMMGIISSLEHIAKQPMDSKPKRWPWQPDTVINKILAPEERTAFQVLNDAKNAA